MSIKPASPPARSTPRSKMVPPNEKILAESLKPLLQQTDPQDDPEYDCPRVR